MRMLTVVLLGVGVMSCPLLAAKGKPGGSSAAPNPTNLTAIGISETRIDLSWTSGGGTTSGFIIKYQAGTAPSDCSGGLDVGASTTNTLTGLQAATTYGFRVCSYNSSGVASSGSTVTAATKRPPQPTAPNQAWLENATDMQTFSQYIAVAYDPVFSRVYSGGFRDDTSGGDRLAVVEARNPNGTLATSFSNGTLLINSDNSSLTNSEEFISAIDTDAAGNVYVCGRGCIGGNCADSRRTPSDKWGFIIHKFSPNGVKVWELGGFEIAGERTEQCSSLEIASENGVEFLYAQGYAGGNSVVMKADLNHNVVWTRTLDDGGFETNSPASNSLALASDGVFVVYATNPGSSTDTWTIKLKKLDRSNGAELASTSRSFLDYRTVAVNIHVGIWNGAERLWMTPYHDNRIYRYDLALNLAPDSENGKGCHNLDFSQFGHHILPYDLLTVTENGVDYLYIPGRRHPMMGSSDYDAVILRMKMTADGCESENEAGELFDLATHQYDFAQQGIPDGFLSIDKDANNDVYVTGYQGVSASSYRGITGKYLGH